MPSFGISIASVADKTNATLDPELETYYLMDIFSTRLPALAEDAGRARAMGSGQATRQKLTEAERVEMSVLVRRMADGRSAVEAVRKAGSLDAGLRTQLGDVTRPLDAALLGFVELIDTRLLKPAEIDIVPARVFEAGTQVVDGFSALFDVAAREFDLRLAERLSRLERVRTLAFGVILASLLVAGYLFLGLRRAMLDAIGQIQAGVGRISQAGWMSASRCRRTMPLVKSPMPQRHANQPAGQDQGRRGSGCNQPAGA